MPTGKYANDKAVMNYIVKTYTSGGYTQVDALQGVGYLRAVTTLPQSIVLGIIMLIYGQVAVYRTLRFTVKLRQIICWITLFINKRQRMILI